MMKATVTLLVCSTLVVLTCADFQVPVWKEEVKTRSEQCINQGFAGACDFENVDGIIEYSCLQLTCGKGMQNHYKKYFGWSVAEGTYCGKSKACIAGQCVTLRAHQLPVYTGKETKLPGCN